MDFIEQVTSIFKEEIKKYNLIVQVKNIESVYLSYNNSRLINRKHFKINIYKEYSNIFFEIYDYNDEITRDLRILYFLIFGSKLDFHNTVYDIEERNRQQLNEYLKIVSKILNDIHQNNFEWKSKYDNFYKDLNYIQEIMGTNFSFSHPIYKKFINNDLTWKNDLKSEFG